MSTQTRTEHGAFDVADLCARHNLSRQTIYREIAAGRLRTFKVGRRRKVTPAAEREWIALLEAEAQGVRK